MLSPSLCTWSAVDDPCEEADRQGTGVFVAKEYNGGKGYKSGTKKEPCVDREIRARDSMSFH